VAKVGLFKKQFVVSAMAIAPAMGVKGRQVLTRDIKARKIVLVSSNSFSFIPYQRVQN
jgi:hypothetical protein